MALDQYLAFEGIALRSVGADVKQIGVAAEDFAIPEHNNAAALAGTTVLQADVDRIEAVFHNVPVPFRPSGIGSLLCQTGPHSVNVTGWPRTPRGVDVTPSGAGQVRHYLYRGIAQASPPSG